MSAPARHVVEDGKTYEVYHTLRAANRARHQEWAKGETLTPSWRGNELAGEVGEALEMFLRLSVAAGKVSNLLKKMERETSGFVGSTTEINALADEIGDVMICADLCALTTGINSDAATHRKFNKTSRKYGLSVLMEVYDVVV